MLFFFITIGCNLKVTLRHKESLDPGQVASITIGKGLITFLKELLETYIINNVTKHNEPPS
jgi:hypothetical protein